MVRNGWGVRGGRCMGKGWAVVLLCGSCVFSELVLCYFLSPAVSAVVWDEIEGGAFLGSREWA